MPEAFKNRINAELVQTLGDWLKRAYPQFNYDGFRSEAMAGLEKRELKARAAQVGDALFSHLPDDPKDAFQILILAVESQPAAEGENTGTGWHLFPVNHVIHRHGLKAYDRAMKLIEAVTRRFTAEFAIRSLLNERPESTLRQLESWTRHPDLHLRRLVSEGSRPRLPWAEQIPAFIADPTPLRALLEPLKDDPEEYVRRSVANNLNDISKDHPDFFLDIIETWIRDANDQRLRLIRHACRTLIKQGNPRCLKLLGYGPPRLKVDSFSIAPQAICLGERLSICSRLTSTGTRPQPLIVDYRFHFVKANGSTAPKVFKGTNFQLPARSTRHLTRQFSIRPVTTRRYYSGETRVELLINGQPLATTSFTLSLPK